jgi:hypothetical protein
MTHITFDPYVPLALWVPLALAAAALLGGYAVAGRRRLPAPRWWTIVTLMAVAVAVPLIVLLNPTWSENVPPPPGKPLLTILLDRSASMGTQDAEKGQTRFQAGVHAAAIVARELGENYEVRLRTFAGASSPTGFESLKKLDPGGPATDLAAAIQQGLEDDRPQGQAILLFSDGIHNSGGPERWIQSAEKAKATATPIYVKTLGGPAEVNDIEVSLQQPQELAFVGQRVPVVVGARQRGKLGAKTNLSLFLDDKLVEERDVILKPNDVVESVFYVSHQANGLYRYEVRADGLPNEVTSVNNSAPLLLHVVDQPIRVLLLEGKPYWDTKFLVRTLSSDSSIELTSVVRLAEGRLLQRKIPRLAPAAKKPSAGGAKGAEAVDGNKPSISGDSARQSPPSPSEKPFASVPSVPGVADQEQWTIEKDAGKFLSDPAALASYQIVILGRNAEAFLTEEALAKLRKWLSEGEGSLICFRGPPASQINQRLGELMPIRWTPTSESRFHVQMTGAGEALRWLPASGDGKDVLADLPSLATTTRPDASKTLAVVLAKGVSGAAGESCPVMSYQPVGNGRVVVVEGAGMWRWAFLAPEHQSQEEIYGSLWRSLVRWLVSNVGLLPSQRMALRADKLTFGTDENATATLLVRDWSGKPPIVELAGKTLETPKTVSCLPHGDYPGQYFVAMGKLPEGRYSLRVEGIDINDLSAVAAFDVRGNMIERLDVRARPDVMKRIAQASGGEVLETADPHALDQQFKLHLGRTRPERMAQTMAWDRWWALLGAFAIWGTAWGLRRRSGLV